jgi:hypothetical protein
MINTPLFADNISLSARTDGVRIIEFYLGMVRKDGKGGEMVPICSVAVPQEAFLEIVKLLKQSSEPMIVVPELTPKDFS